MFADKLLQNGFRLATRAGFPSAWTTTCWCRRKGRHPARAEPRSKEIEQQYVSGLVTAGERYNKVVDIWGKAGDDMSKVMMDQPGRKKRPSTATATRSTRVLQRHLHDGRLGARGLRRRSVSCRHARPDGQARWLHHRDAHHRELPRRPERVAVLISTHGAVRAWPTRR